MSGWLAKATGAFRGAAPEQPQPFEMLCECGVRHTGLRRQRQQRIVCRSCGSALFVLPRDVYPPPAVPAPKAPRKRKTKKGESRAGPGAPATPSGKQLVAGAAEGAARVSRGAGRLVVGVGTHTAQRTAGLARGFLALWTPFRLVVCCVLLICVGTAAWTLMSDRTEDAVLQLNAAIEGARTSLDERDFLAAQRHLTTAVAALDRLKRTDDPLAREMRQLHREVTALRNLAAASPFEIAAEADAAPAGKRDWSARFRTNYQDRWLIADADLRVAGSRAGRTRCIVDVPFGIGTKRRRIALDFELAGESLRAAGPRSRAAIVAGQLESCELSSDGRTWVLRLDPESTFLWANLATYRELGFSLDEPAEAERVERLLGAQAGRKEAVP